MRLINFINEKIGFEKFIDEIKLKCSSIVDFYRKNNIYMFRGEDSSSSYFSSKIIKDRKPRDSVLFFHDFLNRGFKSAFGKNLRSESIFCTGSDVFAEDFGKPYMIFPYNDYEVYWSPVIKDIALVEWMYKTKNDNNENTIAFILIRCLSFKFLMPDITDYMKIQGNKILSSFVSEDIINSQKFEKDKAFRIKIAEEIERKYPNCSKEFIKKYYKKGNVKKAILSENELMITGSGYCAVKYTKENELLIKSTLLQ